MTPGIDRRVRAHIALADGGPWRKQAPPARQTFGERYASGGKPTKISSPSTFTG
jgi:hypothetical protein